MKVIRTRSLWMALFLFVVLAAVGCEEEAVEPAPEPGPYADLTQTEHVIQNLLQSYKDRNEERYLELLFDPDYHFYFQDADVAQGEDEFLTLLLDYEVTRRMFLAAKGNPAGNDPLLDRLDLLLEEGAWVEVDMVSGIPCEGCWVTERLYTITTIIDQTTYTFSDNIVLCVKPVDDDGVTRYKILRAYDEEH